MKYAFALLPLLASCATTRMPPLDAPLADYHQHLVSPAFAPIVKLPERDGAALVRELLDNGASFATNRVDVRVDGVGPKVRLVVEDDGPGIAAPDLARVFDRFFTTRGEARGTGLGLALVAAVARAHQGDVTARSEPGRGAVFEVVLPRGGAAAAVDAPGTPGG